MTGIHILIYSGNMLSIKIIVEGNGITDIKISLNSGWGSLHFILLEYPYEKDESISPPPPAMGDK